METVLVALALFLAGSINGTTGFGFAIVSSIGLAIIMDPKAAVILLSVLTPFVTGLQVLRNRAELKHLPRVLPLIAGALVGVVVGSYVLVLISPAFLAIVLGTFTMVFSVTSLYRIRPRVGPRLERFLSPVVGLVAGISNGTVGASGPVLGSYMLALNLSPATLVSFVSITFFSMGLVRFVTLAALRQYTMPILLLGLTMLVPAVAGQRAGFWLQDRLPTSTFQRAVLVVLLVASAYLIGRGVSRLLAG